MANVVVFQNPEFGNVRTMERDNQPWFVGKDVALALGYENPQKAVRDHVDLEDRGVNEMVTPSGVQKLVIINESGVYSLIFASKLPLAKKFKRWVTSEVLPSIRRNGSYSIRQNKPNDIGLECITASSILNSLDVAEERIKDLRNELRQYTLDGINHDEMLYEGKYTEWHAWRDLLYLSCNPKPYVVVRGGKHISCDVGSVYSTYHDMALRWGWSVGKVQRFFKRKTEEGQISVENLNVITKITINK